MEKYNGWTNYATWRVNLDIFDGVNPHEYWEGNDAYELGKYLKDYAEEIILATSYEGAARDYAFAFLSDVNWYEIAKHMLHDYSEEAA